MTPQYILRASLCRAAHCYSSHVPGKGYVGQPNAGELAPHSVIDPTYDAQRLRAAESEIENLTWSNGYAGYSQERQPRKGVLFADWNVFPSEAGDLLERYGFECEWSDCFCMCENCGLAIRTDPDSFWFTSRWSDIEGESLCVDCVQEWAQSFRDNERDEAFEAATEPLEHAVEYLRDDIDSCGLTSAQFLDTADAIDILVTILEGIER